MPPPPHPILPQQRMYPELEQAADSILGRLDQSDEFKKRLKTLIDNATRNNLADGEVRQVIVLELGESPGEVGRGHGVRLMVVSCTHNPVMVV